MTRLVLSTFAAFVYPVVLAVHRAVMLAVYRPFAVNCVRRHLCVVFLPRFGLIDSSRGVEV